MVTKVTNSDMAAEEMQKWGQNNKAKNIFLEAKDALEGTTVCAHSQIGFCLINRLICDLEDFEN